MCWSFLPHVRFLILLTVFELLPKTCNFTICGHVGWCTASPDTMLKLDTLVMIQTMFGFHWSSTFRGEDFWKSLRRTTDDDGRQVMAIAHLTLGSGELKNSTGTNHHTVWIRFPRNLIFNVNLMIKFRISCTWRSQYWYTSIVHNTGIKICSSIVYQYCTSIVI